MSTLRGVNLQRRVNSRTCKLKETFCESFVSDTVTDFGFSLSTVSLPALHHESPRGARFVDSES